LCNINTESTKHAHIKKVIFYNWHIVYQKTYTERNNRSTNVGQIWCVVSALTPPTFEYKYGYIYHMLIHIIVELYIHLALRKVDYHKSE
jgi:hypothetical protein